VIISSLLLIYGCHSNAQQNEVDPNYEIVEMLTKNKLNLELFELAFVLPELAYIIENDSTGLFDQRIQNAFNPNLSAVSQYVHSIELGFLLSQFAADISLKSAFPVAVKMALQKEVFIREKSDDDFSVIYKEYIQYPEQVDDISLITLLTSKDCRLYENIAGDKMAMYNFNNWLEYGFDEFRYYPDSKDSINLEINNKLVDWIMTNAKCPDNPLVRRSKKMLKEVVGSY